MRARVPRWAAVSVGILLVAKWTCDVSRGFELTAEGWHFQILQHPRKNLESGVFASVPVVLWSERIRDFSFGGPGNGFSVFTNGRRTPSNVFLAFYWG